MIADCVKNILDGVSSRCTMLSHRTFSFRFANPACSRCRFRYLCYKLAVNKYFINFILVMIIMSGIALAAEDPQTSLINMLTLYDQA